MSRILAIDYGTRRTGIAVTDEAQRIAFGLTAISTAELFSYLEQYLGGNQVGGIVVGEPRRLDGGPTHATASVDDFVTKLLKKFPGLPVFRIDERFTSSLASHAIRESGAGKKVRRDKMLVDQVSATIILQSWLEKRETAGRRNT
jgi:putative Holliday junction resolvase